jgi:4-hydroxybenzoate polyprenyltransferase
MLRLLPYLRLLRAGTLFSPGADVVAGMCLCGIAWSTTAASAVLASICVYAAGMVLNDYADLAVDRVQRPERPLPRGDVRPASALGLGLLLLAAGVALAPVAWYHLLLAVLVLAYDFAVKANRPLAAVNMGLLRGLNLGSGALAAASPATPPTALLVAAVAYGLYIAAVTVVGILEDAPRPHPTAAVVFQLVPPVAAVAALAVAQGGAWPAPVLALLPAAWFVRRVLAERTWDQRALRGSMLWLLLGTMLYTALLCAASARPIEAAAIAACIAPARWIARRIALT